jgi:hypothetical protein
MMSTIGALLESVVIRSDLAGFSTFDLSSQNSVSETMTKQQWRRQPLGIRLALRPPTEVRGIPLGATERSQRHIGPVARGRIGIVVPVIFVAQLPM